MALTQVDQGLLGTYAQYTGFKNRIINGAMVIDQRNAGASISVTTGNVGYPLDRFYIANQTGSGIFSGQQTTASTPVEFKNALTVTTTTAQASLTATQWSVLRQSIEGFNAADLGWGTANAATVTLSFWVRSTLTGTFGGSIINASFNRAYPFSYTINAANTWEQKSVTIAGDTTGTWANDNTVGLTINWSLGTGTTYSGTAGAWAAGFLTSVTGSVSLVGTGSANLLITGVQLEKGSTATSFDYRPYGTELALCQRYYQQIGQTSGAPAIFGSYGATVNYAIWLFKVSMRAAPTIGGSTIGTITGTSTDASSIYTTGAQYTAYGFNGSAYGVCTASAEL